MISCDRNKLAKLICFSRQGILRKLISFIYLKANFDSQKTLFVMVLIKFFFEQSLRNIIVLFHDIAGLDMNLEEWKQLCHKAWKNECVFLQLDRFARVGEGRYTNRNCNETLYIKCIPETSPLCLTSMLYSKKIREDLENVNELISIQNQNKRSYAYKTNWVNKSFMRF